MPEKRRAVHENRDRLLRIIVGRQFQRKTSTVLRDVVLSRNSVGWNPFGTMDPRGRKTAAKFWEYRHAVSNSGQSGAYKYADAVGMAERLDNANTLVLFGRDF